MALLSIKNSVSQLAASSPASMPSTFAYQHSTFWLIGRVLNSSKLSTRSAWPGADKVRWLPSSFGCMRTMSGNVLAVACLLFWDTMKQRSKRFAYSIPRVWQFKESRFMGAHDFTGNQFNSVILPIFLHLKFYYYSCKAHWETSKQNKVEKWKVRYKLTFLELAPLFSSTDKQVQRPSLLQPPQLFQLSLWLDYL